MNDLSLPFTLQTELESRIVADPAWQAGIVWGKPRRGHPEGTIAAHAADVLNNVERYYRNHHDYAELRLLALIHDTFKYQVDPKRPLAGENHHGMRARRFAETYITDRRILELLELHDEAFNAWQKGNRDNNWPRAHQRAAALVERLGPNIDLYLAFYQCDNSTNGKQQDGRLWFEQFYYSSTA